MYTIIASFNAQLFFIHTLWLHIYMAWFLLPFFQFPLAPLAVSPFTLLCTPFHLLGTLQLWQNRPPPSQVACKLTLFAPPFTQLSHPFQLPRTPTTQRLTTTTLGPLRSCYAEQYAFILNYHLLCIFKVFKLTVIYINILRFHTTTWKWLNLTKLINFFQIYQVALDVGN
jgi:hypothetical protein